MLAALATVVALAAPASPPAPPPGPKRPPFIAVLAGRAEPAPARKPRSYPVH